MSNDKKNPTTTPTPTTGTQRPAQDGYNVGVGVGSVEYGELIKGGRVFDVVNSMPPPPNPNRGGDDKK